MSKKPSLQARALTPIRVKLQFQACLAPWTMTTHFGRDMQQQQAHLHRRLTSFFSAQVDLKLELLGSALIQTL